MIDLLVKSQVAVWNRAAALPTNRGDKFGLGGRRVPSQARTTQLYRPFRLSQKKIDQFIIRTTLWQASICDTNCDSGCRHLRMKMSDLHSHMQLMVLLIHAKNSRKEKYTRSLKRYGEKICRAVSKSKPRM